MWIKHRKLNEKTKRLCINLILCSGVICHIKMDWSMLYLLFLFFICSYYILIFTFICILYVILICCLDVRDVDKIIFIMNWFYVSTFISKQEKWELSWDSHIDFIKLKCADADQKAFFMHHRCIAIFVIESSFWFWFFPFRLSFPKNKNFLKHCNVAIFTP